MREILIKNIVRQEFLAAKIVVDERVEFLTPKDKNPDNLTRVAGVVQGVPFYLAERVMGQKSPAQISLETTREIIWGRTLKNGSS